MRIERKIEQMSALDIALYLYSQDVKENDLNLFAGVKTYLNKDAEFFRNNGGDASQWLARCVFQNETCKNTLETFVQLHYSEHYHPLYWVRSLAKSHTVHDCST